MREMMEQMREESAMERQERALERERGRERETQLSQLVRALAEKIDVHGGNFGTHTHTQTHTHTYILVLRRLKRVLCSIPLCRQCLNLIPLLTYIHIYTCSVRAVPRPASKSKRRERCMEGKSDQGSKGGKESKTRQKGWHSFTQPRPRRCKEMRWQHAAAPFIRTATSTRRTERDQNCELFLVSSSSLCFFLSRCVRCLGRLVLKLVAR